MGSRRRPRGVLETIEEQLEGNKQENNGNSEGTKKKKVRRGGKKIKNKLKKFKMIYVNMRGYKSKKRSLKQIIDEEKPTMIAIAETLLEDDEKEEIEGYHVLQPAEKGSRGIMIAVTKELKNITSIVMEDNSIGEQMWIQIYNGQISIRIGLIYAPQESRTKVSELRKMYKIIEEQVIKGKERRQKVMIVGDLNCKIGKEIPGNTNQVTTGGRLLLKLIKDMELTVLNAHENCLGLWTRIENGKRSVIDYALIEKEHVESVEEVMIDEKKEITPYGKAPSNERTYTDHNTIKVCMNWITTSIWQNKERMIMNEQTKAKFKEETNQGSLSQIWKEEGSLQDKYNQWTEEVQKIAKKHFITRKKKKKQINRTIRKLRRKRKELKLMENKENSEMIRARRRVLQQLIEEEAEKQEKRKVIRVANNIKKESGFDANAFWKFQERMKGRKSEPATAMIDEEGKVEEDPEKIKEIYKTFYQKLLKDREPEDEEEQEMQDLKEKCIEVMMKKGESKEIKEITGEEYELMKRKLKKKKAPDEDGWRYEWILEAGTEMEESIKLMFNEIRRQKTQPEQWRNMRIKSTTKKANKRMDMNYKRGLFLTNILSKCMERIMLNRNKSQLDKSMQPNQNGGVNERSIGDVLFIINNTVAEFKTEKKDLYILFGDLEKCFDKLYLKDCIIELIEAGMPLEEAMFVYDMNRNIKAYVDTPHGTTEKFEIHEAVRQGTIFGTTLCGVSTNRINKMGLPEPLLLYDTVEIGYPIYVDDMSGMGSPRRIEDVGSKMAGLERTKKYQVNNNKDKTEFMVMKNNKDEKENVRIEVRKGEIGSTDEYKCLGDYYDTRSNNEIKILKKMEKAKFMACEIRRKGASSKVGHANMAVRLLLLETIAKPTLLSNTETWCNITIKEENLITSYHHEILCTLFNQPRSTPYWGILGETGIWPYKEVITYKKLMFLHHIIHSSDDRIAKKIVLKQQEMFEEQVKKSTWFSEIHQRVNKMNIDVRMQSVEKKSKSSWKREVKKKIQIQIEKEFQEETKNKTKLRHLLQKPFQMEEYVQSCEAEMVEKIMNVRLNMVESKCNYKGKYVDTSCFACGEEETTEHLLECNYYKQFTAEKIEGDVGRNELCTKEWLMKAARAMDTIQELRRQHISV